MYRLSSALFGHPQVKSEDESAWEIIIPFFLPPTSFFFPRLKINSLKEKFKQITVNDAFINRLYPLNPPHPRSLG